jgi:SET domain
MLAVSPSAKPTLVHVVVAWILLAAAAAAAPSVKATDHGKALSEWLVKSHQGQIHKDLEIKRSGGKDSPFYGMFAKRPIQKGSVLLEIPGKLVVGPPPPGPLQVGDRISVWFGPPLEDWFSGSVQMIRPDNNNNNNDIMEVLFDDGDYQTIGPNRKWELDQDAHCATVRYILDENKKGKDSMLYPYIQYLNGQPRGQVPAAWSDAGHDLFQEVLGLVHGPKAMNYHTHRDASSRTVLPPELDDSAFAAQDFYDRCGDMLGDDYDFDAALNYYFLLNQRGWDELMIPVFDLMSHGNGRLLNTHHDSVRDTTDGVSVAKSIKVYASRDIKAGEEITTTYNFCANCENRFMGYGTPELLRDYGFVESFPQRWFFHKQDIAFEMDHDETTGKYTVQWLLPRPRPKAFEWLHGQLLRLQDLTKTFLQDKAIYDLGYQPLDPNAPKRTGPAMPDHEFDTLHKYHQALMVAITECLKAAGIEADKACQEDTNNDSSSSSQTCNSAQQMLLRSYGKLDFEHPNNEKWNDDRPMACAEGPHGETHPYHTNDYRTLQIIKSPYQEIEFFQNKDRNDDTCFQLDRGEILQLYCTAREAELVGHQGTIKKKQLIVFVNTHSCHLLIPSTLA